MNNVTVKIQKSRQPVKLPAFIFYCFFPVRAHSTKKTVFKKHNKGFMTPPQPKTTIVMRIVHWYTSSSSRASPRLERSRILVYNHHHHHIFCPRV